MKHAVLDSILVRTAALAAAVACSACAGAHPAAPAAKAAAAPSVSVAASAPARAAASDPAPVPMPTSALHKLSAVVQSVDGSAGTVVVKDRAGKTRTLRVAAGAKLTKGGEMTAIALSDLAAGDRVSLRISGDVVASLHVKVAPAS